MVSREVRALRGEVQKVWKSIEAEKPARLRPPVMADDLAMGGVG